MKIFFFLLLCFVRTLNAQIQFDENFSGGTLRFDFYHTGNRTTEIISFDKLIEDRKWSGSKKNLIDQLHYGNYMFKIIDKTNKTLIYSSGFGTLFQEWHTTEEAKNTIRSFSGSMSFPYPKNNFIVQVERRDSKNNFQKIYEKDFNPHDYFIMKEKVHPYNSFDVHYSGEPSQKLDIVFIPEGYSKTEIEKFHSDCSRLTGYLFDYSPFKENKGKINIWGVEAPSSESGTDIPGKNIWKQTLLNSRFYTFDSERYLMTTDYHTVCDIAANAPHDIIYILVNTDKYGGGAIYNYYSMTSVDNKLTNKVFVHELAHGLAGLADEYGDDDTYQNMYPPNVEPWEPNLTTMIDFEGKWENLIESGTPIPTPVEDKYKNKIGVFEGGGYVAKGVFRPTFNSIMNSFTSNEFNQICKDVLIKLINKYSE